MEQIESGASNPNNDIPGTLSNAMSSALVTALTKILENPDNRHAPQLLPFLDLASPTHRNLPLIRACLQADVPVWLHGEAGSGKSTLGEQIAAQLELPFRALSLGPTSGKVDLLGHIDANSHHHRTGLREIYEATRPDGADGQGGVFLFDEVDNANPSILTILNSLIANGHGEFPDGRVARHQNARFIAAANTIGRGATAQYVGRAPIDAATIDRFAFIQTDIDEDLETYMATDELPTREAFDLKAGGVPDVKDWLRRVRAFRYAASDMGIRTIVSTRATLYGRRLIEICQIGVGHLDNMLIYKGMKEEDRSRLSNKVDG
jgi:MoxR-like ATPase